MKRSKINNDRIMVSHEFGKPVYIAPLKDGKIQVTDNKEHAELWSEFDGSKLNYHKAVTGYKELQWELI